MKMATTTSISTLTIIYYYSYRLLALVILLPSSTTTTVMAIDIAALLHPHPDLSQFSTLLSATTSIASDISHRSSITILAIPNHVLQQQRKALLPLDDYPSALADVLLELLSWPSLRDHLSPQGKLVTTLFQTTGRAANGFGSLNLTRDPTTGAFTAQTPIPSYSPSSARVLALIESVPYSVTVLSIDSILVPTGIGGSLSTGGSPLVGLDIAQTLIQAHDFNVAAAMISASGVAVEFDKDEQGAGISLFIPTDSAFATLSQSSRFQNLPADLKAMVLQFHVLHAYYPLGSLQAIVNPVQPTIATELSGVGRFTLNISKINGSVSINTGIVQATVSRTVFDQNPVAIFRVSKVLLPTEFFGDSAVTDYLQPTTPGGDLLPESSAAAAASRLISSSPPGSDLVLPSTSDGGSMITTGNLTRRWWLVLLFYSSCYSTVAFFI